MVWDNSLRISSHSTDLEERGNLQSLALIQIGNRLDYIDVLLYECTMYTTLHLLSAV